MKEKWLYNFDVEKTQKVKETVAEKDADGNDIEVSREVEKKIPNKFHILNPTRKIQDDASIFYSVKVSEGIKLGLVTKSYLMRKFQQEGVLPNAEDKKIHAENYSKAIKLEVDMETIKQNVSLSDAEKDLQISPLKSEYQELRTKIFDYENLNSSLFDNTAEKRASDLLNLWFVLHLLYAEKDGSQSCLFGDGSFDQKLDRLNAIEDSGDEFLTSVLEKGAFLIGRLNSGSSKEDLMAEIA
jgi:hypothetical protein